jgi:hypothetical protein
VAAIRRLFGDGRFVKLAAAIVKFSLSVCANGDEGGRFYQAR